MDYTYCTFIMILDKLGSWLPGTTSWNSGLINGSSVLPLFFFCVNPKKNVTLKPF